MTAATIDLRKYSKDALIEVLTLLAARLGPMISRQEFLGWLDAADKRCRVGAILARMDRLKAEFETTLAGRASRKALFRAHEIRAEMKSLEKRALEITREAEPPPVQETVEP